MKTKLVIFLLLALVAMFSCKPPATKELSEQEKLQQEIVNKEKELFKTEVADPKLADEMIKKYIDYAGKYPKDSLAPEYLFKASEIAMNFDRADDAITYLTRIEKEYTKFDKYPACIFLKAFVYENYILDFEMAKLYYTQFLNDYPDHKMAKDAEAALLFLGVNDEELIDLFEQINKYN